MVLCGWSQASKGRGESKAVGRGQCDRMYVFGYIRYVQSANGELLKTKVV